MKAKAAGDSGKLFGSVTAADVVDAVRAAGGPALDKRTVEVPGHIKTVGTHPVAVRLHPEVTTQVEIAVVAELSTTGKRRDTHGVSRPFRLPRSRPAKLRTAG